MKTAISLPDSLYHEAEEFADELGMSRSELYATALKEYIQQRRKQHITEQYNRVYSEEIAEVDPALAQLQFRALPKEDW